jgi:hypothetical protein
MTAPVFVDSNIFLYAVDDADPRKQRVARDWRGELWKNRRRRVSFQGAERVLCQCIAAHACGQARAEVRDLLAWNPVVVDGAVMERGKLDGGEVVHPFLRGPGSV